MRTIGIPVTPPKKSCDDPECPFHGSLPIRGRLLQGKVVSIKADKMVVLEREYQHFVKKYMRYERRRSKIHAHLSPCLEVSEGDTIFAAECRPLAKSVYYVAIEKVS